MTTSDSLSQILPLLESISYNSIKKPTIPTSTLIQESYDLQACCNDDLEALMRVGMDVGMIDSLNLWTKALNIAQTNLMLAFSHQTEMERDKKEKLKQAFQLRKETLITYRFTFYKDKIRLKELTKTASHKSNSQLVQDLHDLYYIGSKNIDELSKNGFTPEHIATLKQTAKELTVVLSRIDPQKSRQTEAVKIRNKVYHLVKSTIDEIYRHGKFAFAHDRNRRNGYKSQYNKMRNSAYRRSLKKAKIALNTDVIPKK